jgi:hypothetical protein
LAPIGAGPVWDAMKSDDDEAAATFRHQILVGWEDGVPRLKVDDEVGCSDAGSMPPWLPEWSLDYGVLDYGVPLGGMHSVFTRSGSKCTVSLDCNHLNATFDWRQRPALKTTDELVTGQQWGKTVTISNKDARLDSSGDPVNAHASALHPFPPTDFHLISF